MKRSGMLLLAMLAAPAWAQEPAQKIMDCMRANVPQQLTIGMLELTVYDRTGGSRQMRGRMFTRKEQGANGGLMTASLRIDGPPEFKGAAYLVRETDDYLRDGMFVYLPGVKRVRRVTGTFADASLMGTNFSYFDFKQLQNAFGDLQAKIEPVEHIHGRPTHVLSFTALPGAETRYTSVKAWIDQQACVAVRGEFYEGKRLVKELSSLAGSLKQSGSTWYVSEVEMRDPVAGTRTVLRMGSLDAQRAPANRYFDPTAFFMGP
jgi:hypothetical protein